MQPDRNSYFQRFGFCERQIATPPPSNLGLVVVIPCFNLGAYLDETVQSVLEQTRPDFEVIVIDDGSTDEQTRELLRAYHRPRTRVVHTSNRGLAQALDGRSL